MGSYRWTIPLGLIPGDYRIIVEASSTALADPVLDISEAPFKIVPAPSLDLSVAPTAPTQEFVLAINAQHIVRLELRVTCTAGISIVSGATCKPTAKYCRYDYPTDPPD